MVFLRRLCRSIEALETAGGDLAQHLLQKRLLAVGSGSGGKSVHESKPGAVCLVEGLVGTGKSVFCRGLIRHAVGDPGLTVASPTFLLLREYALPRWEARVRHYDLYRLPQEGLSTHDIDALELRKGFREDICLVEWPERAASFVESNKDLCGQLYKVHVTFVSEEEREVIVEELNCEASRSS